MLCGKCNRPFCWLCLSKLTAADPYAHFRSGKCDGKLFDGLMGVEDDPGEDEDDDVGDFDDGDDDPFGLLDWDD